MSGMKLSLVVLAVCLNAVLAEKFAFDGYKLLKIQPKTELHLETISQWENNVDFDLWSRVKTTNETVTALLSPEAFAKYKMYMALVKMPFEILHSDAEKLFQEQEQSMRDSSSSKETSIVGKFARYDAIQSHLTDIVSQNPDIASSYVAGSTYEKRNLRVLVLKTASSKRNIWIDCGIHAREWITPATCIWTINELIKDHRASPATSLLNYYEIHILPLVNPDGYEYTHTTYRMWRKNRSPNAGSSCIGTDLNRNWGYKWFTGGSSNNPCSDTFAGPKADSELETKGIEAAILKYQGRWDAFFTIHSYGLWWFTNWGYTTNLPPNYADTVAKAQVGVNAIKSVNGLSFLLGSSARILYIASGGSEDWAYGVAQVPYTYCLELRPGQTGTDSIYGFALPENRVPKAGAETYAGLKAYLKNLIK